MDRKATKPRKEKVAVDRTVIKPEKLEMVEQSLSKFLKTFFPESSRFWLSSVLNHSTVETDFYEFLLNIGNRLVSQIMQEIFY